MSVRRRDREQQRIAVQWRVGEGGRVVNDEKEQTE
jgi:hypothetical protein